MNDATIFKLGIDIPSHPLQCPNLIIQHLVQSITGGEDILILWSILSLDIGDGNQLQEVSKKFHKNCCNMVFTVCVFAMTSSWMEQRNISQGTRKKHIRKA